MPTDPVAPAALPDDDSTPRHRRDSRGSEKLQLVLRSSPPGALAAVDGKIIGPTPTYWRGDASGNAREFTFVLDGHALARYRFVPLRDGVVHATLKRVTDKPRIDAMSQR
jgi:hypothetical protein